MNNFRVLVISGNCLSKHNSNGRTLLNLLHGFSKENIYQIYTSGEYPTDDVAAAYLRVSNRDVVSSLWKCKGIFSTPQPRDPIPSAAGGSGGKNALTMLGRDVVWDMAYAEHKALIRWAESIGPRCILLQLGDSALQITIAMRIASKLNIPIVTYNTEDYYFKDYDFMRRSIKAGVIYKLFHRRFQKKFQKLMKKASASIYNCEGLKALYDSEFQTPSYAVFAVSDFKSSTDMRQGKMISYAGNLGVGRHLSLIKIADRLQKIDDKLFVDVYGNAPAEVIKDFEKCTGIRYHGFVSYQDVCKIISDSFLLLHTESFDAYYQIDARYAFSTKLVDCLKSGVPTFLFAPAECEAATYFKTYDVAFVVTDQTELEKELINALRDVDAREQKVRSAIALSEKNHNIDRNSALVLKILEECS